MSPSLKDNWRSTRNFLFRHEASVSNATAIFNTAASATGIPTVPELQFTPGEEEEGEDTRVSGKTKEDYIKDLSKTAYDLLQNDFASIITKLSKTPSQDDREYASDVRELQMKLSEAVGFANNKIETWGGKLSKSEASELAMTLSPIFDNWKLGVVMPSEEDEGARIPLRLTSSATELTTLDGSEFCKIDAGVIDRLGLRNEEAYTKYSDRAVTASVATKSASGKPSGIGGTRYEES
jgi:hypothetical protein